MGGGGGKRGVAAAAAVVVGGWRGWWVGGGWGVGGVCVCVCGTFVVFLVFAGGGATRAARFAKPKSSPACANFISFFLALVASCVVKRRNLFRLL